MYCTKCGKKLKAKDKFCTDCGKPVNEEVLPTNPPVQNVVPPVPQKTSPVPFIIAGVVIGGVILFLFFFVFLFLVGVYESIEDYEDEYYNYNYNYKYDNKETEKYTNVVSEVVGEWESAGGSYFVFKNNKTFYWYKTKEELNDNYYYGTMEVKKGEDALNDLGISLNRVNTLLATSGKVGKNDVYSIKLYPTYLISDGVDKSKENLTKGSSINLLFVKLNTHQADAYNFKTGDIYYLDREEDTI